MKKDIEWLKAWFVDGKSYTGGYVKFKINQIDNAKNLSQELPVISKYVADWVEEIKPIKSLRVAFDYIAQRKANDHDDKLALWVEEGNSETFARAWLDGYTVEEEPLYYALVKGHELMWNNRRYWARGIYRCGLSVLGRHVDQDLYSNKKTKSEWAELGINDSNADFKEVDEDD